MVDIPGVMVRCARLHVARAEAAVCRQEMNLTRRRQAGLASGTQEAFLVQMNETLRTCRHSLVAVEEKYPAE